MAFNRRGYDVILTSIKRRFCVILLAGLVKMGKAAKNEGISLQELLVHARRIVQDVIIAKDVLGKVHGGRFVQDLELGGQKIRLRITVRQTGID